MKKVKSPCNSICQLNADNICIGCGRTSYEIKTWKMLPPHEQQRIAMESRMRAINLLPQSKKRK